MQVYHYLVVVSYFTIVSVTPLQYVQVVLTGKEMPFKFALNGIEFSSS
jgi:hypothetical protein